MIGLSIYKAKTSEDYHIAGSLFKAYAKELQLDLSFQNFGTELQCINTQYGPPHGSLLLATLEKEVVGCVGVRAFKGDFAELKRMYILPNGRGKGIGRKLLKEAINEAKEMNYKTILLDTLPSMNSAINLYQSFGFEEIKPYRYNPVKGTKYLRLNLLEI